MESDAASSRAEAQRALLDFYQEQIERNERLDQRPPPSTRPFAIPLIVFLVALSVYLWRLPPAWLVPPPPAVTTEQLETGLRMDLFTTALAVERHRENFGALPVGLDALVEEADPDLSYVQLGPDAYRLAGERDGVDVRWESTQPLSDLLEGAGARALQDGSS